MSSFLDGSLSPKSAKWGQVLKSQLKIFVIKIYRDNLYDLSLHRLNFRISLKMLYLEGVKKCEFITALAPMSIVARQQR